MHEYCHRCGGQLSASEGASPFCPHCASPQLYLQDYEEQTSPADGDPTGAAPPQRPQQVEWKTAIRCAWLVAGVAAVLSLVSAPVELVAPRSWALAIRGAVVTL